VRYLRRPIILILLTLLLVLAALAIATAIGTAAIERAHPPQGRMLDIAGGKLHVVELGPRDAPAVVLVHGASGNLLDMKLALGDRLASRYRVILVDRPGHGWSERPHGDEDASPARQAAAIHEALGKLGIPRAIVVGHSWAGALATAYALAYPSEAAGLVLLAPVTHPWPGGVGWFNDVVAMPIIGRLVAQLFVLPAGYFFIDGGVRYVFSPQQPPPEYASRTAVRMILRPSEFVANAQDLVGLKAFVTAQAPRYGEIAAPVVIISGDQNDKIVYTDIHSRATAAQVKNAKLTVLPGVGHMVNHVAADLIVQAIDDIARQR
jgi:pimeloyl-ACP methyl ester carboxylesterase